MTTDDFVLLVDLRGVGSIGADFFTRACNFSVPDEVGEVDALWRRALAYEMLLLGGKHRIALAFTELEINGKACDNGSR